MSLPSRLLTSKDVSSITDLCVRLKLTLSDAVKGAWMAIIGEIAAWEETHSREVGLAPEHLFLGLLGLGLRDGKGHDELWLPGLLVRRLEIDEKLLDNWKLISFEHGALPPGERHYSDSLNLLSDFLEWAREIKQSVEPSGPCIAARHFVAAWLQLMTMNGSPIPDFLFYELDPAIITEALREHLGRHGQGDDQEWWKEFLQEAVFPWPPPTGSKPAPADISESSPELESMDSRQREVASQRGALASNPAPLPAPSAPQQPPPPDTDMRVLLAQFWAELGTVPTPSLNGAMENVWRRRGAAPVAIDPDHLLLGLLQLGEQLAVDASPEVRTLQVLLWRSLPDAEAELPRLWQASFPAGGEPTGRPIVSPALMQVLGRAVELQKDCSLPSSQLHVASRHVLAAMIEHYARAGNAQPKALPRDVLQNCLQEHLTLYDLRDKPELWQEFFAGLGKAAPGVAPKGTSLRVRREPLADELCLGIETYSRALQEVIANASSDNDFVLGLFAPWGRGKSTLIAQVAQGLKGTHHKVVFGAAKYPSRPEVWVNLYQTISDAASAGGFWNKWALRLRLGLLRTGWAPLFIGAFMASFSFFDQLGLGFIVLHRLLAGVGVLGFVLLFGFLYRFMGLGKLIRQMYGHVPDHSEKLGLQAVIGDDLNLLLRAWVRPPKNTGAAAAGEKKKWQQRVADHLAHKNGSIDFRPGRRGWWALALFVFIIGYGCWHTGHMLWEKVPMYHTYECEDSTVWKWAALLGPVLVFGLTFITACKISRSPGDGRRVLLIVDDLDRCEPDQSLAVIESIRWFLDNPEVSSRLHVAMLMERTALEAACKKRARDVGFSVEGGDWPARFQAHREKLFVVELTLPELDEAELRVLVSTVIDSEERRNREAEYEEEVAKHVKGAPKQTLSDEYGGGRYVVPLPYPPDEGKVEEHQKKEAEIRAKQAARIAEVTPPAPLPPPAAAPLKGKPGSFADEEREALKKAFSRVSPEKLTPRAVRAAVVRYQFARHLLILGGDPDFEPAALMERLLDRMFNSGVLQDSTTTSARKLDRIIFQLV